MEIRAYVKEIVAMVWLVTNLMTYDGVFWMSISLKINLSILTAYEVLHDRVSACPWLSCCPSTEHQQVTYSSSNAGHCLLRDFVLTLCSASYALLPYFFMVDPGSSFRPQFKFQLFWKFFSNRTCAHPFLSHYGVVFSMDHNLTLFVYLLSVIAIATAVWNLQG